LKSGFPKLDSSCLFRPEEEVEEEEEEEDILILMETAGGPTVYSEQLPPAVLPRRSANYQPKTWDYNSICSMQHADNKVQMHSR
jgi:hypothetical protein